MQASVADEFNKAEDHHDPHHCLSEYQPFFLRESSAISLLRSFLCVVSVLVRKMDFAISLVRSSMAV